MTNALDILPLGDRILIEIRMIQDKTASGIIIPKTKNNDKTEEGEILIIGKDVSIEDFSVGEIVIYDRYAGIALNIEDKNYLIIKSDDIVAKVRKK